MLKLSAIALILLASCSHQNKQPSHHVEPVRMQLNMAQTFYHEPLQTNIPSVSFPLGMTVNDRIPVRGKDYWIKGAELHLGIGRWCGQIDVGASRLRSIIGAGQNCPNCTEFDGGCDSLKAIHQWRLLLRRKCKILRVGPDVNTGWDIDCTNASDDIVGYEIDEGGIVEAGGWSTKDLFPLIQFAKQHPDVIISVEDSKGK